MKRLILMQNLLFVFVGLNFFFTNCDSYSNNNLFDRNALACEMDDQGLCVYRDASLLEITAPSDVTVPTNSIYVDVFGTCNSGGYAENYILARWEHLSGYSVSDLQGITCQNGRYGVSVPMVPGGANIIVEIVARDSGVELTNEPLNVRKVRVTVQ